MGTPRRERREHKVGVRDDEDPDEGKGVVG